VTWQTAAVGGADIDEYLPIADYAFLSDCHSTALVSRSGSVDWACFRRFDSPTVFCRLLDHERGGHFSIRPADEATVTRRYLDGTLVLESEVRTDGGVAVLTEAMVMRRGGARDPHHELVRVVRGVTGTVHFDVCVRPRFDYGWTAPMLRHLGEGTYTAVGGAEALVLHTDAELQIDVADATMSGAFEVHAGSIVRFLLTSRAAHEIAEVSSELADAGQRLEQTVAWWQRWSAAGATAGPHESRCHSSVRVLKGLTCAPTGAIVAAATTSLPEQVGANRNWDYRYSWVRDSSLVLEALVGSGHAEIAAGFRDFLLRSAAGNAADLQIMYGAYGERRLPEMELELSGYRSSRPVRVGNAASSQTQLDVYGHLLDAVDTWHDGRSAIDPAMCRFLRDAVDIAAQRWREPDQGIWEMRGEPQHFVNSKVMCWVALDRGIGLASLLDVDEQQCGRWQTAADELRREVFSRGVDPERGCFRQHYATNDVDASLLKLPLVGFVAADDPVMMSTVEAIQHDLTVGEHGFIRRYAAHVDDGVAADTNDEGVFMLATCWLIEVLTMLGRRGEAIGLFERVVGSANDLGLYSEEVDVRSGELLGNFPQAFTHLGVLVAARRLDGAVP